MKIRQLRDHRPLYPLQGNLRRQSGITLIEMLSGILLLCAIIYGLVQGTRWGSSHGRWAEVAGAIIGAVLGGAGFFAAVFLLMAPFSLYGAIKRGLEPADLVCTCHVPGRLIPDYLNACKPVEQEALAESHRLADLVDSAVAGPTESFDDPWLKNRLAEAPAFAERIALATQLGHADARALEIPPREPLLRYKSWAKLPKDMQTVLRSGLPPRLCLVWAMACAQRVLPVFEREFHQDKRPRIAFGAALLLLKNNMPEALVLCRPPTFPLMRGADAGCRVSHRDLWTRLRGKPSKGELARKPMMALARAAADFVEPRSLWMVHPRGDIANGYMTAEHRCAWPSPWFHAENIAGESAAVAENADLEFQWQRQVLTRLILGWTQWDEDRRDWQHQVEEQWIPRVKTELTYAPFKVPGYIERLRNEWVPWKAGSPACQTQRLTDPSVKLADFSR